MREKTDRAEQKQQIFSVHIRNVLYSARSLHTHTLAFVHNILNNLWICISSTAQAKGNGIYFAICIIIYIDMVRVRDFEPQKGKQQQ